MKLLVVDGNSIVNRAYYGIKALTTKNGEFTNGIYGFLLILRKMLDEVNPDRVAVAFDLREPTFRHKMYDKYKAQRKGMPKELAGQLTPLKELLKALGYKIVTCSGYEADDIIGTLATACKAEKSECIIATGDRDSLQLVGDGVTVRLAITKQGQPLTTIYDSNAIFEKYGVTPAQLIDVKALMGDPSDNIPGVAGIGEKTAFGLIAKYGTLESIYEHLSELTKAIQNRLETGREMASMSRNLARIDCACPVDTNLATYKIKNINQPIAAEIFSRLEMYKMQKKWNIDPTAFVRSDTEENAVKDKKGILQVVPISELDLFIGEECDCLLHLREDDNMVAALIHDGKVLFTDQPEALQIILEKGVLRVWRSKPLYKYAFENGIDVPLVRFDGELAAYLLNPSSSSYQLHDLASQYAIIPREIEGPIPMTCMALVEDVQVVSNLFRHLENEITEKEQEKLLQDIEIPLARVLASMEIEGFALDTASLKAYGLDLDTRLANLQKQIYELAGESFNIKSPKQLSTILFDKLELPAKKRTKTGYSTDADVLESLKNAHPIIACILDYRQLIKLKSTYVDGLLKEVCDDGRVRTTFQQTETRTGRISSVEPNLQNIPIRTEEGSKLRAFFHAREDWKLLDADYSQIELRVLAHISQDENMCHAFCENADIHTATASQVFHMPQEMVTANMRFRAKAVNFGIVYGISAFSLAQDIGVTTQEADDYIKNYLETYSGVRKYMEDTIEFAKNNGYVKTMFGRRRNLPELAAAKKTMRSFGERVAMNMPIQGTAADIIKIAMIRVYERLRKEKMQAKLILQVHDELIVEAPEDEKEKGLAILKEEMENAIKLSVPLKADTHYGNTWLEAK